MNKRPEITKQTRNNLNEAFWQIYCEKELRHISIKDITDKAGYNRGTFYQYYTDVYDLLNQFEDALIEYVTANIKEELGFDYWDNTAYNVVKIYEAKGVYLCKLFGSDGDPNFVEKIKRVLQPLYFDKFDKKDIDNRMALMFEYTISGILAAVTAWSDQGKTIPVNEMVFIIRKMVKSGAASQMTD